MRVNQNKLPNHETNLNVTKAGGADRQKQLQDTWHVRVDNEITHTHILTHIVYVYEGVSLGYIRMHSIVDTCQVSSIYRAALLPCCTSAESSVSVISCVCSHCIYLCCCFCFFFFISYFIYASPFLAACLFRFRNSQSRIRFGHFSFGNSTRHFRSHWVKGKSKLNCPKAAAEIYDLFVLSDQTGSPSHSSPFLALTID